MTRRGYKARAPLAVAVLSLAAGVASAQKADFKFERDCADWIEKHGYSTDYIKLKTGKRQRGAAAEWRGNVEVNGARLAAGDATKLSGEPVISLANGEKAEVLLFDLPL